MDDSKKEIKKIYILLYGLYKATKENDMGYIRINEINRYNVLIDKLYEITNNDEYIIIFKLDIKECTRFDNGVIECHNGIFYMKVLPILEYLENMYIDTTDETIQKVGSLYNAINDTELQKGAVIFY